MISNDTTDNEHVCNVEQRAKSPDVNSGSARTVTETATAYTAAEVSNGGECLCLQKKRGGGEASWGGGAVDCGSMNAFLAAGLTRAAVPIHAVGK